MFIKMAGDIIETCLRVLELKKLITVVRWQWTVCVRVCTLAQNSRFGHWQKYLIYAMSEELISKSEIRTPLPTPATKDQTLISTDHMRLKSDNCTF